MGLLKIFSSGLAAFLIFAASNHCVIEELLGTFSQAIIEIDIAEHHDNHLGSSSQHTHDESSESHQHGQPHQLVIKQAERNFFEMLLFFIPLILLTTLTFKICATLAFQKIKLLCIAAYGAAVFEKFIISLIAAPQAPPSVA